MVSARKAKMGPSNLAKGISCKTIPGVLPVSYVASASSDVMELRLLVRGVIVSGTSAATIKRSKRDPLGEAMSKDWRSDLVCHLLIVHHSSAYVFLFHAI